MVVIARLCATFFWLASFAFASLSPPELRFSDWFWSKVKRDTHVRVKKWKWKYPKTHCGIWTSLTFLVTWLQQYLVLVPHLIPLDNDRMISLLKFSLSGSIKRIKKASNYCTLSHNWHSILKNWYLQRLNQKRKSEPPTFLCVHYHVHQLCHDKVRTSKK